MSQQFLQISDLHYRWPSQSEDLFTGLSLSLGSGWTGLVGENGQGKSTLLSLIAGSLCPVGGTISVPGPPLLCEQRTDAAPSLFEDFACLPDAAAGRIASKLGISSDWPWRWDTLSHGERKRAQIACALWQDPDVLLADEPTNHLDAESRTLLADALASYRGIGIIVSHDRQLLDRLSSNTLVLEGGGANLRPGGISAVLGEMDKEALAADRERRETGRELKRVQAEARRRSREATAAVKKNSKRGLSPKDHDAKSRIDQGRLAGKDIKAGAMKKRMDIRVSRAAERAASAAAAAPRRRPGGITLNGTVSRSDRLASLNSGSMDFSDGRRLEWPELSISPDSRIALTGPNGGGKSRFLGELLKSSETGFGALLVLPQEIPAGEGAAAAKVARELPKDARGEVYSVVDRLGSDPVRLMETAMPSPGETRKLLLALGLAKRPAWVVMDEPTNHLDLFSIKRLETALAGYSGALLLVSHDRTFLETVTDSEWRIVPVPGAPGSCRITWSL